MPLAATQEGEASGSRAPALRRGRSSTAPAAAGMSTTRARSMALARTGRQSSGSQSAQGRKRRRRAVSNQRSNKRKRASRREEEVSSAGSSPIRVPHIPDEVYQRLDDPDSWKKLEQAQTDYDAKLARSMTYPTLNVHMVRASMSVLDDPELVPDRESASKAVLGAAQSVVGISSSVGGKPLARGCGFWVDWDEKDEVGIILTTSRLICTKSPSFDCWLGQEEYDLHAEVRVHLWGDTPKEAHLQYLQKHYNLAFFRVKVDRAAVHLPSYNVGVKRADHVFELGRDKSSFLRISYGVVKYLNPNLLERYHYMFFQGADPQPEYDNGGPLINFVGEVVGMVNGNTRGSFIPASILVKCVHLWKKFKRIPRPQLRMKFWSIKFVDLALAENILRMCNIDDGLLVKEVSEGSDAEKLGIRAGDVIECFNGERISTTVELENMLLSKCVDESGNLSSKVDVELGVFHIRKSLWRTRTLSVDLSEDGEVVDPGVWYPFGEGTSVSSLPTR